jgi:chaperonin GroEL (HSP60 family)
MINELQINRWFTMKTLKMLVEVENSKIYVYSANLSLPRVPYTSWENSLYDMDRKNLKKIRKDVNEHIQ